MPSKLEGSHQPAPHYMESSGAT